MRAVRSGLRLLAAEHRVDDRCRAPFGRPQAELLAAPADHGRRRGDDSRKAPRLAVGRERHVEGALLLHGRERIELEENPRRIARAQVHRQRLGEGAEPARLLGAVDPDLERRRRAALALVGQLADEEREGAERMADHVRPRGVAARQLGPPRPAQRREHGPRHPLERETLVDLVRVENGRRRLRARLDAQHRAEHRVRPIGRQALQARLPGVQVEVLEVGIRIVGRNVDRLRDRGVDERSDRRDHLLVRLGAHLERGDERRRQRRIGALQVPEQAPRVVLDRVLLERAVGHSLPARVASTRTEARFRCSRCRRTPG